MKDSDDQDLEAGNFQESALTQRLLRRAKEPIGVINVRHAAQLGARTAGWIERRFELLDNWKTRYGLDQGAAGAAGSPLPGTERMPPIGPFQSIAGGGPGPLSLVQPSVMRTAMPGAGDETASNVPPSQQFRVKRLTTIPDANRAKVSWETEPVSSDAPDAVQDTSALRADQSPPLSQATEIRVSTSSSPQMHLQRRAIGERAPTITSGEAEGSAGLSSANESPAGEGLSAGTAHEISSATASLPQVSELPPVGGPAVPMPLQHVTEMRRESGASAAPMHLQRKFNRAENPGNNTAPAKQPGTGTPQENGRAPASGDGNRLPTVAQEICTTHSAAGAPSIVWRKADAIPAGAPTATATATANAFSETGLSTGSMHAGGPQIMRETVSSAPAASSPSPTASPVAPPLSGNSGTDDAQMAERVIRIIARQMAIERERRGKTK